MNEELIMKMVEPSVRNGVLTYELFEKIFSMLSRQEQYQVCEILNKNNIQLFDSYPGEETSVEMPELSDAELMEESLTDDEKPLFDNGIFKDASGSEDYDYPYTDIKQSNDTLIRLVHEGNKQARQDICIKNKKLVWKYAKAYYHLMGNDLDFDDLMQAGFIGLLTAAERFDFAKDAAFSTYAVIWIKQAISRQVYDLGYRIRIPVHMMERIRKAMQLDRKYADEGLNYQQRKKCIAEEMSMPERRIEELFEIRYAFLGSVSLDTPVGEEEDSLLSDFIPADIENNVENQIFRQALASEMGDLLKTLTPREERVIRSRFGLDDGHAKTLDEIGKEFNVTRERIRQIEARAIRKLRNPARMKRIEDYYSD